MRSSHRQRPVIALIDINAPVTPAPWPNGEIRQFNYHCFDMKATRKILRALLAAIVSVVVLAALLMLVVFILGWAITALSINTIAVVIALFVAAVALTFYTETRITKEEEK